MLKCIRSRIVVKSVGKKIHLEPAMRETGNHREARLQQNVWICRCVVVLEPKFNPPAPSTARPPVTNASGWAKPDQLKPAAQKPTLVVWSWGWLTRLPVIYTPLMGGQMVLFQHAKVPLGSNRKWSSGPNEGNRCPTLFWKKLCSLEPSFGSSIRLNVGCACLEILSTKDLGVSRVATGIWTIRATWTMGENPTRGTIQEKNGYQIWGVSVARAKLKVGAAPA